MRFLAFSGGAGAGFPGWRGASGRGEPGCLRCGLAVGGSGDGRERCCPGGCAGLAGESAAAGGDGLEDVVGGGPEGEFGVDVAAAVAEGAAEAGGELGEDGLDGGGALLVEGFFLGGVGGGGPFLPP